MKHYTIQTVPIWGKTNPYESVFFHSDKVAVCMEILPKYMHEKFNVVAKQLNLSFDETCRLANYLAGVHDIGKIIPVWQKQPMMPEESKEFFAHNDLIQNSDLECVRYRHERGGADILKNIWEENDMFSLRIRNNLAAVVLVHHQKLGTQWNSDAPGVSDSSKVHPQWRIWHRELESYYRNLYLINEIEIDKNTRFDAACMVLSGLLNIADWMGSSLSAEPYDTSEEKALFRKSAEKFISEMRFSGKDTIPDDFQEMWPWITEMRPLQETVSELMKAATPMLTIIEDVMGAGKTESGIFVAETVRKRLNKNGIYVALPTSATANQMHDRVDDFLSRFGQKGSRLLHGTAWLKTKEDSDEISLSETFLQPARMGLLTQNGVGTIDQLLMTVLRNKFCNLRMAGIADKVLLIDEVHSYDAYMNTEIIALLHWCRELGIPVVILSATLPNDKRQEFVSIYSEEQISSEGYPRITTVDNCGKLTETIISNAPIGNKYSVKLHKIYNDTNAIAEMALDKVKDGGCLCVNVNTVSRAIEIAEILSQKNDCVFVFHSRYTMARRAEIEKECISMFGKDGKRPTRAILVATQVVEQSLDIDFDFYMTDICPIDLVLQRMGRQFRHKDTKRPCDSPVVDVLIPENGNYEASALIYMPYLLDKTIKLLSETETITTPNDIQSLVNYVYQNDGDISEEIKNFENRLKMEMANSEMRVFAQSSVWQPPGKLFQMGFAVDSLCDMDAKTRMARPTVRAAILPHDLYEKILNGTASREEEECAYQYTFTINYDQWKYEGIPKGTHMFSNIFILEGSGDFSPTDDAITNVPISVSRIYGIKI